LTIRKPAHGTAGARRLALAKDVCANLKTVIGGVRAFPPDHPTLAAYTERMVGLLREFLEREGPLTLEVSSTSLSVDGHAVMTADSVADSLSNPLFLDGVSEIAFAVDVPAAEVSQLCELWSEALGADAEGTQTFTTRCWEASFGGIRVVSVDTFVELLSDEAEREFNALLAAVDDQRRRGPTLQSDPSLPPRIGPADLIALRRGGLVDLRAPELEARPAGPVRLEPLQADECQALAAEIEAERARQSLPALVALSLAPLDATPDERAELIHAEEAVFLSVARAAGLAQIQALLAALVEEARADVDGTQRRFPALQAALEGLGGPAILSLATDGVRAAPLEPVVENILSFLQPSAAGPLLDCIALAQLPAAEALMPRLLALKPRAELIASRVARVPAPIAMALLEHAATFPEAERIQAFLAAVAHPDGDVRHHAATRVPRADLIARPETLYPLVTDSDTGLRQLAISLVLTARDDSVAPYLLQLLDATDLPLPERRRVIRSLGSMPTRTVIQALRKEFRTQPNPETAATCAIALGRVGDEGSRNDLLERANKRFGHAELKKACLEAIRMLDARKARPEASA
jgi:hypothetical protein